MKPKKTASTYRNLIANTSDIIYSLDAEGAFTFVSSAWTRLLGYPAADVEGRPFTEFVHPDDLDRWAIFVRKVLETEDVKERAEYRVRRKSGEWRWHSSSARAVRDASGAAVGMDGIARDITDRKRAEMELRESEANLRSIIEGSPIGYHIYTLSEDGRLVFSMFNPAADAILRTSHTQFLGKDILDAFPALAGTGIPDMYRAIARGELGTRNFENPYNYGGICGVYEVRTFRGAVGQTVVNFTDISERKRDEESIRQAQKLLAAQNKELEQIVYVASHDLRSPLVNVDGFSREMEYSLKEIEGLLAGGAESRELEQAMRTVLPELSAAINRIRSSARQMDGLLKGLLTLSRSGRRAIKVEAVDMDELMRQVSASFAYRIMAGSIELTVEELPPCRGDAFALTQVFSNLMDNAIKYLGKERPGRITIRGTLEDGRARYKVEDNGIGIADNHQEKIFELFHRLNPKETEGEGLGLTIARQIVGRMDGEIGVESMLGVGSAFIVTLPAA